MNLTPVYRKVPEGYVAYVKELPGAHTQGRTFAETRANIEEATRLVLEANRQLAEEAAAQQGGRGGPTDAGLS